MDTLTDTCLYFHIKYTSKKLFLTVEFLISISDETVVKYYNKCIHIFFTDNIYVLEHKSSYKAITETPCTTRENSVACTHTQPVHKYMVQVSCALCQLFSLTLKYSWHICPWFTCLCISHNIFKEYCNSVARK